MKKMVRVLPILIGIMLCISTVLFADEPAYVTVTLNGNVVDCASYGQQATIIEDRTLVPLRAIFEALGADIVWDDASRKVISVRGKDMIELAIGSNVLIKNNQQVEVDVPARIMNDRTMVPVRVIAESFGVKVDWDNSTRTVILECDEGTFPKTLDVQSQLKDKHIFGEFFYGMTMQNAWDAIGEGEGEKSVFAFPDERAEIQIFDKDGIYTNEDVRIMGSGNCNLVRLLFADDYLYAVYAFSDYLDYEGASAVRKYVVDCYGEKHETVTIMNDEKYGQTYVWTRGDETIKCRISKIYESSLDPNSKLGDVCGLYITDESVEKLLRGESSKQPAYNDSDESEQENVGNSDKGDITEKEDEEDDVKEPEDDKTSTSNTSNELALATLETYIEACNSFNLTLLSECCIDSFGLDKLGIENVSDVLSYAGITKNQLSETMLKKSYRGNEAYRPLTDAIIDTVFEFVLDASDLLYYTVDGVKSESKDRIVFEITHYTPDISLLGEAFAESFDRALKKAFADGSVSFDMTQEQMMPILSEVAADELREAFEEVLDKETFVASKPEYVTVVEYRSREWLVELDENTCQFIRIVKKGGNEILELFGFEVK